MIKSIDAANSKTIRLNKTPVNSLNLQNKEVSEGITSNDQRVDSQVLQGYYVSFGGFFKTREEKIFDGLQNSFTLNTQREWESAADIAKAYKHKEVTHEHLYAALLEDMCKYIDDLNSGVKKYEVPSTYVLPACFESVIPEAFKDEKTRNAIAPVLMQELQSTHENLQMDFSKRGLSRNPQPTKELLADLNYMYTYMSKEQDNTAFTDNMLLMGIMSSQDDAVYKMSTNLVTKLQAATMTEKTPAKEKIHLKFYDDKADNLWKNVGIGNDMFVVYDQDNETSAKYLLNSFGNLINKPGQQYKNLNAENTNLVYLNKRATFDYLSKVVDEARKTQDKTTVIVADFISLLKNAPMTTSGGRMMSVLNEDDVAVLENKAPVNKADNIRIVLTCNKDSYDANISNPVLKKVIGEYGLHSLPILTAEETKKILTESPDYVKKETKKVFKPNAITRSIEISNMQEGNFPEKTVKLMKNIAGFYIDKEEINLSDVNNYLKETKGLLKTSDSNNSFKVVFDTGKKLKDIVGNGMTKAEAASIVKQIRDKSIGTKGFIIYSNSGSSGGGRRHTAEAIAGESGIPFIPINARDFALKDIDALSQNADLSEVKIKKLVSMAKTQAEANKHKSAMIFIENFDNFGANPLTGISSIYEQKAFSQLLTEMENIRKNENINLVIVGSANYPEYIDEAIQKPYKFLDQIVVYSPQDKKDRIEVLKYYIKKNGLKIAGETPEDKAKTIQNIAETTSYFSVVNLMDLLDKAKIVSKERGHKAIDEADFNEAYLRATSGRPYNSSYTEADKAVVTTHEGGHGATLVVMNKVAEKLGKPWFLPDKLDFITLDPRGSFGGMMKPKDAENSEFGFAQLFADLVCDFGGNSCEKKFYGIDGSWGISQDMHIASSAAQRAVQYMGLGFHTGKRSIPFSPMGTLDVSPRLRDNIDKDIEVFLKNANLVSDKIVDAYAGFLMEFTDKYKSKVGTGECIIPGKVFQKEMDDWAAKQSPKTRDELEFLEKEIIEIMEKTKRGELAN